MALLVVPHKLSPQGSCSLRAFTILFYINDLPKGISSPIRPYYMQIIIYKPIVTAEDVYQLQQDNIDMLSKWAKDWLMSFNLLKCEHLIIKNKHTPVLSDYHFKGYNINKVSSCKYLRVIITSNLHWSKHITDVVNKAYLVRGFLQRNLRQCSVSVKVKAYFAFVRPIVEYASYSSVTSMLRNLKWDSLEGFSQDLLCFIKLFMN